MAAAPDPSEVLHSTNGKANFQRVARLLISGGTALLREIFDQICPPSNLPTLLKNPATVKQLKAAKLTKPQWDCLYPSPGVYGKSSDFDVTLLFRLLRTICNLIPPVTGWDALPASTDHSLAADLGRIKYYRNSVYGHVNQSMEVADDEFLQLWQEISEALVRIAGQISPTKKHEWQVAIINFLKNPLTTEDERNVQELKEWYRNDMEVKKSIEELKSSTQQVESEMERLKIAAKDMKDQLGEEARDIKDQLGVEAQDIKDKLGEEARDMKDQLGEEAQDIKDQLGEEARDIKDQLGVEAQDIKDKLGEEARDMKDQLGEEARDIKEQLGEEARDIKDQLGEVKDKLNSSTGSTEVTHGVQLQVKIDCKTITERGRVGSSEEFVVSQGHQAGTQGTAVVPIASSQPQAEAKEVSGVASTGNYGLPSPEAVLSLIALRYFQSIDPSTPEDFNGYLQYLKEVRDVLFVGAKLGSLIITVECRLLEILEGLWNDYCSGYLNEMAQKYLVTEDILKELDLAEVKLTTTILEEEYKACREYFMRHQSDNARGTRVTEMHVLEICDDIETCWHDLGISLSLPAAVLRNIDVDYMLRKEKSREMLYEWRKRSGRSATVESLAKALERIGYRRVAQKLLAIAIVHPPRPEASNDGKESDPELKSAATIQVFAKETLTEKEISFSVLSSDIIRAVKNKIHEKAEIPVEQMRLFCDGKLLEDDRTLSEYNFHKKSALHLVVVCGAAAMGIFVKIPRGETIELTVFPEESISKVKRKLENKTGMSAALQQLTFEDKELADLLTLRECNIQKESVLLLARRPGDMPIHVRLQSPTTADQETTITLKVLPSYMIGDVKEMIAEKLGIQTSQHYMTFFGKKVEDYHSLSNYNIRRGQTLDLIKRQ